MRSKYKFPIIQTIPGQRSQIHSDSVTKDSMAELRRPLFSSITDPDPTPPPSNPRSPPASSPPDAVEAEVAEYTEEPLCSQLPFEGDGSEDDATQKHQRSQKEQERRDERSSIPADTDEAKKENATTTLKRPTESGPIRNSDDYLLRRLKRSTKIKDGEED